MVIQQKNGKSEHVFYGGAELEVTGLGDTRHEGEASCQRDLRDCTMHARCWAFCPSSYLDHRILSRSFPVRPWVTAPLGTLTSSQGERLNNADQGDFLTHSLMKSMLVSSAALLRASNKFFNSSLLFITSSQDYQTLGKAYHEIQRWEHINNREEADMREMKCPNIFHGCS